MNGKSNKNKYYYRYTKQWPYKVFDIKEMKITNYLIICKTHLNFKQWQETSN